MKVFNGKRTKTIYGTKPPLQKILQGILYTEMKANKTTCKTKPQEKKRLESKE
jgi:hypothetical protein